MKHLLFIIVSLCTSALVSHAADDTRPNIIFMLVDDLGKEWVEAYGGENIKTPNLNAEKRPEQ